MLQKLLFAFMGSYWKSTQVAQSRDLERALKELALDYSVRIFRVVVGILLASSFLAVSLILSFSLMFLSTGQVDQVMEVETFQFFLLAVFLAASVLNVFLVKKLIFLTRNALQSFKVFDVPDQKTMGPLIRQLGLEQQRLMKSFSHEQGVRAS